MDGYTSNMLHITITSSHLGCQCLLAILGDSTLQGACQDTCHQDGYMILSLTPVSLSMRKVFPIILMLGPEIMDPISLSRLGNQSDFETQALVHYVVDIVVRGNILLQILCQYT